MVIKRVFLSLFFVVVCAFPAIAQETVETVEKKEYAFGIIVEASEQGIILEEYNLTAEDDILVNYDIDENIQLENIASLDDLKKGAEVSIEYKQTSYSKSITSIYKENTESLFEELGGVDSEDIYESDEIIVEEEE
ncbi:MAG: hypothetical protein P9X22_08000 [Candidatus Zapsychrus exili]|nr:hypothetical protein [Candidatus Zapsychrus exili]